MRPQFCQVNLIVEDMAGMVDFLRTLGLDAPDPSSVGGSGGLHVGVPMLNGSYVQLDNDATARIFHDGWRNGQSNSSVILGFSVETRDDVDRIYHAVVGAGYESQQAPYDAYWGVRYAIVAAPNGVEVAVASPSDPVRVYEPT